MKKMDKRKSAKNQNEAYVGRSLDPSLQFRFHSLTVLFD